jgi:archaellum component FlaG (FlaF/FlaG flagellin family)
VISSPAAYRDVQQELIAEIRRTSLWPVVTVDGNISKPDETEFIDRDGSYIILIPDGNIKSLKAEINELNKGQGQFTRLWIYEARFFL